MLRYWRYSPVSCLIRFSSTSSWSATVGYCLLLRKIIDKCKLLTGTLFLNPWEGRRGGGRGRAAVCLQESFIPGAPDPYYTLLFTIFERKDYLLVYPPWKPVPFIYPPRNTKHCMSFQWVCSWHFERPFTYDSFPSLFYASALEILPFYITSNLRR